MKKRSLYIIIFILFIVAISFIMWRKNVENRVYVKTETINKETIEKYINLIGEVNSNNIKNYYLNDGKYREVKVKLGQEIKKGDIIATSTYGNTVSETDGIVTKVEEGGLSFGASVNPSVVVQDINDLKITVDVNKNDDKELEIGQKALVINNNGENVQGEVSFRYPVAEKSKSFNDSESYVKIDIKILENTEDFTVGFSNEVNILVGKSEDTLVIPIEAIITEKDDVNYVYVLNNNMVERKDITLGLEGELKVEVESGLSEGDEVILNPSNSITIGEKVYRWEQ